MDRAGTKPGLQLCLVEVAHVRRGQSIQLLATDLGKDVLAGYLLVPLERGFPNRVLHRVGEPAAQVASATAAPARTCCAAARGGTIGGSSPVGVPKVVEPPRRRRGIRRRPVASHRPRPRTSWNPLRPTFGALSF